MSLLDPLSPVTNFLFHPFRIQDPKSFSRNKKENTVNPCFLTPSCHCVTTLVPVAHKGARSEAPGRWWGRSSLPSSPASSLESAASQRSGERGESGWSNVQGRVKRNPERILNCCISRQFQDFKEQSRGSLSQTLFADAWTSPRGPLTGR